MQLKLIMQVVKTLLNDKDPKSKIGFLGLMKRLIDKSLQQSPNE